MVLVRVVPVLGLQVRVLVVLVVLALAVLAVLLVVLSLAMLLVLLVVLLAVLRVLVLGLLVLVLSVKSLGKACEPGLDTRKTALVHAARQVSKPRLQLCQTHTDTPPNQRENNCTT